MLVKNLKRVLVSMVLLSTSLSAGEYDRHLKMAQDTIAVFYRAAEAKAVLVKLSTELGEDVQKVKAPIDALNGHLAAVGDLSKKAMTVLENADHLSVLSVQAQSRLVLGKLAVTRLQLSLLQQGISTPERIAILCEIVKYLSIEAEAR